jgi:hypothetical protein
MLPMTDQKFDDLSGPVMLRVLMHDGGGADEWVSCFTFVLSSSLAFFLFT